MLRRFRDGADLPAIVRCLPESGGVTWSRNPDWSDARESSTSSRFLDAVPAGPVGLLFEGDAGIGKTTLWREAVLEALDRSYCVLSCRPVESEGQLAFTALGDLLEEVPDSATAELPVPQRRALEVALLQIDAEGPPPLPRAVSLGVLGVLRALASSGPLVIALDDLQWLDRPSASTLEFAARRLRGEPIGFVLSRRGAKADAPLALDQTLPPEAVRRLLIGPLDGDSLGRLIRSRFDIHLGHPRFGSWRPRPVETRTSPSSWPGASRSATSRSARESPSPFPAPCVRSSDVRLADLAPETHGHPGGIGACAADGCPRRGECPIRGSPGRARRGGRRRPARA